MNSSTVYIILLFGFLYSCSSRVIYYKEKSSLPLYNSIKATNSIDSIIKPYKDSMEQEMNEVLATSDYDFIAERPSSNLMNWVSGALYANVLRKVKLDAPSFCLLNFGSLRSTINKGNVTRGDIFKLMPFDNQVVVVQLPTSIIPEIEAYIVKSGGEPMANAKMFNDKLRIAVSATEKNKKYFYVITSDYLLNGGDHMTFFEKNIKVIDPNILLRDALIEEAINQKKLIDVTDPGIK